MVALPRLPSAGQKRPGSDGTARNASSLGAKEAYEADEVVWARGGLSFSKITTCVLSSSCVLGSFEASPLSTFGWLHMLANKVSFPGQLGQRTV